MIRVYAPGRINIIGEHTDHQGGLVLPAAIDLGITIKGVKTTSDTIIVKSIDLNDIHEFVLEEYERSGSWTDYIAGSLAMFKDKTDINPKVNLTISSTLPIGSGLSSSAALQVGVIKLLSELYEIKIPCTEIAKLAWKSETKFVGVQCGIMDQMVISCSSSKDPMLINCKTLDTQQVSLNENIRFILVNTGVQRQLSTSDYNTRIEELSQVANILRNNGFKFDVLSDLTIQQLENIVDRWPRRSKLFNRLEHVIEENGRVRRYLKYTTVGDAERAGSILYSSHESLRDNFEASWTEADKIIEFLKGIDSVHGARMIGAGWGGNVLIQCSDAHKSSIIEKLHDEFDYLTSSDIITVTLDKGVRVI